MLLTERLNSAQRKHSDRRALRTKIACTDVGWNFINSKGILEFSKQEIAGIFETIGFLGNKKIVFCKLG